MGIAAAAYEELGCEELGYEESEFYGVEGVFVARELQG
jgi:hypothetical protein